MRFDPVNPLNCRRSLVTGLSTKVIGREVAHVCDCAGVCFMTFQALFLTRVQSHGFALGYVFRVYIGLHTVNPWMANFSKSILHSHINNGWNFVVYINT